jgi:hypothetical protein
MAHHLRANGVNIDEAVVSLGPWLDMDPETEIFGGSNAGANTLLTRNYRPGYVVPECPA